MYTSPGEWIKRYLLLLLGLTIMAFGVAFSIKASLGTSPISSVPYAVSAFTPLTVGTATIAMHCVFILIQILILRKKYEMIQLMQLPVAFFFGYLTDLGVWAVNGIVCECYWQQWLVCLIGILLVAVGVSLEVKANVVVLAGIAVGAMWTAATTVLQFYATDVGLSAAVIWSFGDLGRATYRTDWIMLAVVAAGTVFFMLLAWRYNALLSGGDTAGTLGVNVALLRFASLLTASVMTAVCVSFLGIIGFVGIICPHTVKRLMGQDHRWTIPASALSGSLLLLLADLLSRSLGSGSALPVGAITSLLGAPFFLTIIFARREATPC